MVGNGGHSVPFIIKEHLALTEHFLAELTRDEIFQLRSRSRRQALQFLAVVQDIEVSSSFFQRIATFRSNQQQFSHPDQWHRIGAGHIIGNGKFHMREEALPLVLLSDIQDLR